MKNVEINRGLGHISISIRGTITIAVSTFNPDGSVRSSDSITVMPQEWKAIVESVEFLGEE